MMKTSTTTTTLSQGISQGSERKASRQCWECLKRRLVCDHTLPHCKKCIKAGKECPGYDEKKPLQWVQPGKVTSRRRRKDAPPSKSQTFSPPQTTSATSKPQLSQKVSDELRTALVTFADRYEKEISNPAATPAEVADRCGRLVEEFWVKNARLQKMQEPQSEEQFEKVIKLGDRRRIEEIVRNRCNDGAREILKDEEDALKRLERLLRHMDLEDIPCYNLTNETSDVVQAVHYYNLRIFPTLQALKELAPNPSIMIFPVGALHLLPPSIHHILVCISLNHFIHSLPAGANRLVISSNACKVYQHRGYAIRMLSEKIGKDKTRCSDLTMTSVLMFLCLELQQAAATDWRTHAMGLKQLIDMRGGHMKVIAEKPYLAPCLILFVLIVTYANTTSSPLDMIHLTPSLEQHITDLSNIYSFIFPMTLCPPTIFYEIVRINHLRSRASSTLSFFDSSSSPDPSLTTEAHELLNRIESFDPDDWAQPGKHFNEWVLLGTIHQSAAALYCTMSLQALGLLPESLEMNAMRSVHGDRLLASLREGSQSERLEKYMTWPLVVMGVEAIYRDHETRRWLDMAFVSTSQSLGTSTPLKARALLNQYWERGIPGWEECFVTPQAFIV